MKPEQTGPLRHNDMTGTYAGVWGILLLFTAITVAAASLHLGRLAIVVCLAIAAFKSVLVFLYFMHLRHENRPVIRWVIPIAIITLTVFIGLTYLDVATR